MLTRYTPLSSYSHVRTLLRRIHGGFVDAHLMCTHQLTRCGPRIIAREPTRAGPSHLQALRHPSTIRRCSPVAKPSWTALKASATTCLPRRKPSRHLSTITCCSAVAVPSRKALKASAIIFTAVCWVCGSPSWGNLYSGPLWSRSPVVLSPDHSQPQVSARPRVGCRLRR